MRYLSPQEILIIHAKIIDETGGLHGIRDTGLLASLSERPKTQYGGKELYQGVFKKTAIYLESIIQYHVFLDGNKRTAISVSARFLFINGYILETNNKELEKFVLRVAIEKLDTEKIAEWFKKNSKKIRK